MPKLNQRQFYDVGSGKKFTAPVEDIDVVKMKNKKIKGGVPALRVINPYTDNYSYKFIKRSDYDRMVDKFGKGKM
jgi:hypothetical protein